MPADLEFGPMPAPGLDLVAEIGLRPDNRPVRLIANGRRHKPVGAYFSVKSGRQLPWESRNELHDFWRAEVNPEIVESWAQPHVLKIVTKGQTFRYTPDRMDRLSSGQIQIVEIKDVFESDRDPLYAYKLRLARAVYETNAWSFRIIEKAEIEAEPAFSAVNAIQTYRCTNISAADVLAVRHLFADSETLSVHTVQSVLRSGPAGLATVCALIVHRVLACDLHRGFNAETPVQLVTAGPK